MSLSAYRIGNKVYILTTNTAAETEAPRTLPIGSPSLSAEEARAFAGQVSAAADDIMARPLTGTARVKA